MLTRILQTEGVDTDDDTIQSELSIDLRRMDRMEHKQMPQGCDAYRVMVRPSLITYHLGLHRFRFELQYGNIIGGEFRSKGEVVNYQTETLPMI